MIEKHERALMSAIDTLTKQRDAYAKAADTMAAAHKVERDALTAANGDLQAWFDVVKADHDELKAELEIARMVPYVAAMSEIAKERDALKDAARLALDALVESEPHPDDANYENAVEAIAALKAVL